MKNKIFIIVFLSFNSYANTLLKYYDIALENSYLIKESHDNYQTSKYKALKIDSKKEIDVSWNTSLSRIDEKSSNLVDDNTYNKSIINITLNKNLYSLENTVNYDSAKLEEKISYLNYEKTIQTFSKDFLDKYLQVYKDKKYYQLTIKNDKFAKKLFDKIKKLFKIGLIAQNDFSKIKTYLQEAKTNKILSKLQFEKSKNILKIILHTNKLDKFIDFNIKSLEKLNITNLVNIGNIDISIIKLQILSLKKKLLFYDKWYYPSVDFNINYSNINTNDPTSNNIEQTTGKIVISGSLYKNKTTINSYKETLALLKAKRNKKNYLIEDLKIRLQEINIELKSDITQFNILSNNITQKQLELNVQERKNKIGLVDYIQILKQQNSIYEDETKKINILVTALKRYINIQYELNKNSKDTIYKIDTFLKQNK